MLVGQIQEETTNSSIKTVCGLIFFCFPCLKTLFFIVFGWETSYGHHFPFVFIIFKEFFVFFH